MNRPRCASSRTLPPLLLLVGVVAMLAACNALEPLLEGGERSAPRVPVELAPAEAHALTGAVSGPQPDDEETRSPRVDAPAPPSAHPRATRLVEPRDPLPEGAVVRIGTVRLRHSEDAEDVAYSPDGERIASVCRDLRIWDAHTGGLLAVVDIGPLGAREVAWHPDGERLVVSGDAGLALVDPRAGGVVRRFALEVRGTFDLELDPDGVEVIAGTGDGHVGAWVLATGERTLWLPGHDGPVWDVALSHDGRTVLSAGADERIQIIDREARLRVTELSTPRTSRRVGFLDAEATRFYTAGLDGVRLWQLDGAPLGWLGGEHVRDVVPLDDGRQLLVASGARLTLWDTWSGTRLSRFDGHRAAINGVALSPDERFAATASDDNTVRVWDVERATSAVELPGDLTELSAVSFVPGRDEVIVAGLDGAPLRVDLAGRVVSDYPSGDAGIELLAVSADGRVMAASDGDRVELWRVADGTLLRRIELGMPLLDALVLTPDGRALLGAWEREVVRWPTGIDGGPIGADRVPVLRLDFTIDALALSSDGNRLAIGGGGRVEVFDLDEAATVASIVTWPEARATDLDLSADGRWLAIATGRRAMIADVQSGGLRTVARELPQGATRIAFTPDAQRVVVAGRSGGVAVLDRRSLREEQRFDTSHGSIDAVAVSPDGRYVASVTDSTSAVIWQLEP